MVLYNMIFLLFCKRREQNVTDNLIPEICLQQVTKNKKMGGSPVKTTEKGETLGNKGVIKIKRREWSVDVNYH